MATQLTESIMMFVDHADQVISMTNLRRAGKVLLDRIANGEQDKYVIMHEKKPVYVILPIAGPMELNHANQIISVTELQRNGKELLGRFKKSGQKKFIVMRMNKPIAIVMPSDYEMDIVMHELEALNNKLIPHHA